MSIEQNLDLSVPRNGDYYGEWQLVATDGSPLDITGHIFAMDAREIAGDSSVIASATVAIVEALSGSISVWWKGADFDPVGELTALVKVAYDLKHTYPDGKIIVPVRGTLSLIPEATA